LIVHIKLFLLSMAIDVGVAVDVDADGAIRGLVLQLPAGIAAETADIVGAEAEDGAVAGTEADCIA